MHVSHDEILANLAVIREGIDRAADRGGREPNQVLLVAAAKNVPLEPIAWIAQAGVKAIGENYVKGLRDKAGSVPGVRWHFIGTLQTNSVHHVAALADVVETVTGEHATDRLARRAAAADRTLDALLEVDFTGERAGVRPEGAEAVAKRLVAIEGLRLHGLMTLPPLPAAPEDARPWFRRLRDLRDRIQEQHPGVVDLSMGMSLDYEVAVEEGATMIRIGTALFGPRTT